MFPQRIASICLLLCYGIPAILGPGWHRHDDACSHSATSHSPDHDSAQHAESPADHDCCHQACDSQDSDELSSRLGHKEASGNHVHGPCVICAFYSQVQGDTSIQDAQASEPMVIFCSFESQQLVALEPASAWARGPPRSA